MQLLSECGGIVGVSAVTAGEGHRGNSKTIGKRGGATIGQPLLGGVTDTYDNSNCARKESGNVRNIETNGPESMGEKEVEVALNAANVS